MSIEIYNKANVVPGEDMSCSISLPMIHYPTRSMPKVGHIMLSAWDIHHIQYLAIKHSNDHRALIIQNFDELAQLVNRYRGYENSCSNTEYLSIAKLHGILKYLIGMTSEQFLYHNKSLGWAIERFNRNYHILVASKSIERAINVDDIVKEKFGLFAEELMVVLLMIFWLCSQNPDILTAPENLYRKKDSTVFTKENIEKVVRYYAVSYDEVRESTLGYQIFYSKPFVKTQKGKTLMTNLYLIIMLIADGLYWIVRDYYREIDNQSFTNDFGLMFESYLLELCGKYLNTNQFEKLPQRRAKSADFVIYFEKAVLLIEVKSALFDIGAKQQRPNMERINKYFSRNINQARSQLSESEKCINGDKPIIKVIILYENFQNSSLLQMAIKESYPDDKNLFVATANDFENLLSLYCANNSKVEDILSDWVAHANGSFMDFHDALKNIEYVGKRHLLDTINHFDALMNTFKNELI